MMNEDVVKYANHLSSKAVEYGKSFSKRLDFSSDSIKDIEEILDYYSNDLKKAPPNEKPTHKQIWSMASIWGAYIGEVIKKRINNNCEWSTEEFMGSNVLHLKIVSDRIFPLDKAYKRLVNGKEDNICSFFDTITKDCDNL
jgi:hypothetical protein